MTVARPDGSPVYIGYAGETVVSPNGAHRTVWTYETEMPRSDSLNGVMLDGVVIPGRYWGRGHAWSPDSGYFTLESYADEGSVLRIVRVADLAWLKVAKNATTVSLDFPHLVLHGYGRGDDGSHTRLAFTGHEQWAPLASPARWVFGER
jgi:hypothetical protein